MNRCFWFKSDYDPYPSYTVILCNAERLGKNVTTELYVHKCFKIFSLLQTQLQVKKVFVSLPR